MAPSLFDDLATSAAGLDGVSLAGAGASREVFVSGRLVAVLHPDGLEVRLRPAVATAALRTPDVTISPRGRGWVRFAPAEADEFARDRALAWLESAVRLALEAPGEG